MTEPSGHRWLGYENPTPGRFVAVCSCGWRSPSYTSAGLAGSASDQHRREVGVIDANGQRTDLDGQPTEPEDEDVPEDEQADVDD